MSNPTVSHSVDVCVIGGGMSGVCAALAAARGGASVMLVHDRPVLGGNASSECRMHICGADRHNSIPNMRETGILEELRLENLRVNPTRNYNIWDGVLYDSLVRQENLQLMLNSSVQSASCDNGRIESVTAWQLTTYSHQQVSAKIFIDCSGDGILAPLVGADFAVGREARDQYDESIAPEVADKKTMGMTCLFQATKHDKPMPFTPPVWANKYEKCDQLRGHDWIEMGYWWIELGGEHDSIADTEYLRHELLKITYGVWDHIKNHCENREKAANWALEWIQFLPAKRESRRYLGPHVLNQNDVSSGGKFDDIVAYGGWTMDDHDTSGFKSISLGRSSTIFHPAPVTGYGISYRNLYSRNIANLMFAGRDASCSHAAMSSTRVMGTCCSMGQAVGTAAAMAVDAGCDPAGVGEMMDQLQDKLLRDDSYLLPYVPQKFCDAVVSAKLNASSGDASAILDGINRPVGDDQHAWTHKAGDQLEMIFDGPQDFTTLTLILDTMLDTEIQFSRHQGNAQLTSPPPKLPRDFTIEFFDGQQWLSPIEISDNYQRLVRVPLGGAISGVRYTLQRCWSDNPSEQSNMYAMYAD